MKDIKQYDIVIVGQQPWDVEIGSNCKNIALELSKNNRVLYVNSPLKRSSLIRSNKDEKIQKRWSVIQKKEKGLIKISDNLWNLYPDCLIESVNWLPDNFIFDFLNKRNNQKFAKSIKKALIELNFEDFILFNDNDIYDSFYLKDLLLPNLYVYYSRDNMISTEFWKKHGTRLEPLLLEKSDLVVANSVYLTNYCKKYNPNSHYVGQGCEFDLFSNIESIQIPSEVEKLKKPVIGYVGLLSSARLDIEIIKKIALDNPDWSIVLVGPEDKSFQNSDLHDLKNIYFKGAKPVSELASYIKSFDVCINPQILNDLTIGNYPRKIDEYLAMGKPVVATKTEAMDVFCDYVLLAGDKNEYQYLIENALATDSKEKQNARIEFALSHTWENSVNLIYMAMSNSLNHKLESNKTKLKNTPLIILGLNRFDSDLESTSFNFAKEFAKENDVYYVDNPYTLRDYFNFKGTRAFDNRKKYFFNRKDRVAKKTSDGINIVIPPLILSINFFPEGFLYRLLLKFNERLIINCIKRVLKTENIKDFIFINAFNFHLPEVGKALHPSLYIYHCVDPLILEFDRKHGLISERQIIKECDIVICTSKQLYKEKKKLNPYTYFVPNAADVEHFNKALTNNSANKSPLLNTIDGPIVGYIGNIERRIDFKLIADVSKNHPDKNFVFVGPVCKEYVPDFFYELTNVFLLGKADYDELPVLLKQFDIAIIPFKKDEVSNTIFPLKLFEYLGAGKPVVSSAFNEDLKDFTKESVVYCTDAESFSNAINDVLNNDTDEKRENRLKIAKENTWKIRFIQFKKLILRKIQ